jgi:hypothetical protein
MPGSVIRADDTERPRADLDDAQRAQHEALARAICGTPSIQSLVDSHAERQPKAIAFACASTGSGWCGPRGYKPVR